MTTALVSVLMTVKDETIRLRQAINDILSQSYQNLELIIVDDGSGAETVSVIHDVSSNVGKRMTIVRNETSKGRAAALNQAVDLAKGDFLAIADSDDSYHFQRLEKQVRFLEANHEIGICGTGFNTIPKGKEWELYGHDGLLKAQLLINYPMVHPSLMYRRMIFDQARYNENLVYAMDYALLAELREKVRLANLPEKLITYRINNKSEAFSDIIRSENSAVRKKILAADFDLLHDSFAGIHNNICNLIPGVRPYEIKLWIKTLLNSNKCYSNGVLKGVLNAQAYRYGLRHFAGDKKTIAGFLLAANIPSNCKIPSALRLLR